MLLEEKLEGRKVQFLPFLLSRNMNYHTLKNEGFCPNEVIHFKVRAYAEELLKNIVRIDQQFQELKGDSWSLNEPFRQLVIAPRCYYDHKRKPNADIGEGVLFLTFKHSDEYNGLDSVRGEDGFVDLIEYKWKR